MIQKRNISTFAAGLCLLAFMLLAASPAKAFKTTNPNMTAAYDSCLTKNYKGKAKQVKKCFEEFRTTYAGACLIEDKIFKELRVATTVRIYEYIRKCNAN